MLQKIPVKVNTPEWLELRRSYIGCSDIPILTGSNRNYGSPLDIFYDKIGLEIKKFKMSERPLMGHIQEPTILNLWRYSDGKEWVDNYTSGRVLREFKPNTGYILVNPEIPFMSDTPDGTIEKGTLNLFGEKLDKDAPLQAKNIDSLKWASSDGWIPEHKEQVTGEMLVFGTQYSETVSLIGGNQLVVAQVEYNEDVAAAIYNICKNFWINCVQPAKPLAKRFLLAYSKAEKEAIMKDIMALEPLPDDSDAYRDFLSTRFKNQDNPEKKVKASPDMEVLMNYYQFYNDIGKEVDLIKRKIKNTLLRYHEHNAVTLIQGEGCKSTMNKNHLVKGREISTKHIKDQLNKLKP